MLAPVLLILQIAVAQAQPSTRAASVDTVRLRAHIDTVALGFFRQWRDAWIATQGEQHGFMAPGEPLLRDDGSRLAAAHCHWVDIRTPQFRRHLIRGSITAHATCPWFLPPDTKLAGDERHGVDNGIDPAYRLNIQVARKHLRAVFDSAARVLPNDIELARQRVRFALDDGDLEGAVAVALTCGYAPASCGLLQGLILYRVGDVPRADSTFAAALTLMAPEDRCAWSDVRMLLEPEMRTRYEHMSCAERADFDARLWWLSDPLWSEPGNERRAEHFARKVTAQLITAFPTDGRQHFLPKQGGEAVLESLVRYGWPSQMFWPGPQVDRSHDSYLRSFHAALAAPYMVREYTRANRLHTVPAPSVLDDPFDATRDGWQLAANGDDDWWPTEHYARDRSALVELPIGQSVMLRRRDSTRYVWAGHLDSATQGRTIDPNRSAILFESRSVGDVNRVASFHVSENARLVIDAPLAKGKTLLGIEVPGDSAHAAARSRYAVSILPALSALHGARAVSQAVLLDPPSDAAGAVDTQEAIDRMYTTTTLKNVNRVGVYWESYGFNPGDTVDLTVRIVRKDQANVVMRAIHVFGIGHAGDDSIGVHWRELPQNSRAIQRMEGAVPMQARSIVLDFARLPHGEYVLQLAVNKPSEPAVWSERPFELR